MTNIGKILLLNLLEIKIDKFTLLADVTAPNSPNKTLSFVCMRFVVVRWSNSCFQEEVISRIFLKLSTRHAVFLGVAVKDTFLMDNCWYSGKFHFLWENMKETKRSRDFFDKLKEWISNAFHFSPSGKYLSCSQST